MTLFNDNNTKPKQPRHPRDDTWHELFKAAEARFYESGIADGQRARVANLVDDLRQKGATAGNFAKRLVRYEEVYPNSACTLPAMLNQWDTCAPVSRRQPGMSSDAEQAARRRENEAHRLECENYAAAINKARQVVQLADQNVVKWLHQEWRADPENKKYLRFGTTPTSILCVRVIAERIESINGQT